MCTSGTIRRIESDHAHRPLSAARYSLIDRLVDGRSMKVASCSRVDIRQNFASGDGFVALAPKDIRLNLPLAEIPDFPNAELSVHLELVDAARRPHDLDREIRPFGLR